MTASSNLIRFGTDGWRAIIGNEFTFANLESVAQAYADYISDCQSANEISSRFSQTPDKLPLIVIGFDGRFLSAEFARRTADVLASSNLKVALFAKAVPTPLVSWGVRKMNAAGGIVITASHNPPEYNGFKIKSAWGGSAPTDVTSAVESRINLNSSSNSETFQKTIRQKLRETSLKAIALIFFLTSILSVCVRQKPR